DPDAQVQNAIRLAFETFERTGSAIRTVRFFREQGLLFPRRLRTGPNKGELLWAPPQHARILQVLHKSAPRRQRPLAPGPSGRDAGEGAAPVRRGVPVRLARPCRLPLPASPWWST